MQQVVGVAWYSPKQWQRLKAVAVDAHKLHDHYFEWLTDAEALVARMTAGGMGVRKVAFDVDEWVEWSLERGMALDGESRSEFTSLKVQSSASPLDQRDP